MKLKKIIILVLVFCILSVQISFKNFTCYNLGYNNFIPILSDSTNFSDGNSALNVDRDSKTNWIEPENSLFQNDSYAINDITQKTYSDWLYVYNFGFSFDDTVTINGIEVRIDDYGEGGNIIENALYLYNSETGIVGDNKMTTTNIGDTDTDSYTTYGSSSDLWNSGLNATQIKDSSFGIYVSYYNSHNTQARMCYVDNIQVNIYYSLPEESNAPTWDNLTESNDPLCLGLNETISINVYDDSTISYVYLEIDFTVNKTMSLIFGNTYSFSKWQPESVGIKNYSIYMIDEFSNTNHTSTFNITVIDCTAPTWDTLLESSDPLYLGLNETISINVYDDSTISYVYLEIDFTVNKTMSLISGSTYSFSKWQPESVGIKNYSIYMIDKFGNTNHTSTFTITVIESDDIYPPTYILVIRNNPSEINTNVSFYITIYDNSSISFVYIEYNNKNHTCHVLYGNTYFFDRLYSTIETTIDYVIYVSDDFNNMLIITGSIVFQNTLFNNLIYIILIFLLCMSLILHYYLDIKKHIALIIGINLFSIILSVASLSYATLVLYPYVSILFIVINVLLLIITYKPFKNVR